MSEYLQPLTKSKKKKKKKKKNSSKREILPLLPAEILPIQSKTKLIASLDKAFNAGRLAAYQLLVSLRSNNNNNNNNNNRNNLEECRRVLGAVVGGGGELGGEIRVWEKIESTTTNTNTNINAIANANSTPIAKKLTLLVRRLENFEQAVVKLLSMYDKLDKKEWESGVLDRLTEFIEFGEDVNLKFEGA